MSNEVTIENQNTSVTTVGGADGWADAAADGESRVLKGTLLKFADGCWTSGREGSEVPKGTQLLALATAMAWVKWHGGKPVDYRVRQAGQKTLERETLGIDPFRALARSEERGGLHLLDIELGWPRCSHRSR
jgi:hypothetical protein